MATPPSEATNSLQNHSQLASPVSHHNEFEVVVAHFNEDLSWLMPFTSAATIYIKGTPPTNNASMFRQTLNLPNVGRESHTFLFHIVSRYDDLADVTLFVQGSRENSDGSGGLHTHMTITEMRDKALEMKTGEVALFGSEADGTIKPFNCWDASEWLHECDCGIWLKRLNPDFLIADCSPAELWRDIFGFEHPINIMCSDGAFFAVQAETIRSRPRNFYERLLGKFLDANHINPEIGHMVEKFWVGIFTSQEPKHI